jgi:glutamyl/glutaminyl-tRNA synthetase
VFDLDKLAWLNGVYIRALPPDELLGRVLPILAEAGLIPPDPDDTVRAYVAAVVALERDRLKRLEEIAPLTAFFFGDLPAEYEPRGVEKWLRKIPDATAAFLRDLRSALADERRPGRSRRSRQRHAWSASGTGASGAPDAPDPGRRDRP